LFYSRVESNAEMMAEKVLTVEQALTITDGIELLENMTSSRCPHTVLPFFVLGDGQERL